MTEKKTYIARDGREFDNAVDCIDYEQGLDEKKVGALDGELCFFNDKGRYIPVTKQNFFDQDVDFICITGNKGLAQMEVILEDYGYTSVRQYISCDAQFPMTLMWDESMDKWVKIGDYISELEKETESLKRKADIIVELTYERYGGTHEVQNYA